MESLIEKAVQSKAPRTDRKLTEKDKEIESLLSSHRTRIKVVGCGGAGNNTLSRLIETGVSGVIAVAVNTDAQDLLYAQADEKILIGREITNGLGAGSNPEIGEKSARESQEEISKHLKDSDLVFVTCGLGGGTGTGSAPVVAEVARNLGALTIAVVTLPFTEEGVMRWENARQGLERLRAHSDTVIVVQNDKLLEIAPDMPLNQAFKVADEILANAVKGITELVTEKGLVNLDFADIRAVMKDGGTAMIGLGESNSENKAIDAVEMAVQNPLLDVDITGAKSALINITGGNDMSLKDARIVMKAIAEKLDPAARVIWGARMDPEMEQSLRVMLIVTGLRDDGAGKASASKAADAKSHKLEVSSTPTTEIDLSDDRDKLGHGSGGRSASGKVQKESDSSKPVFNRIFEEETEADLKILNEAVNQLAEGQDRQNALRDIKNAISALNNSAQLFAFNHISYLAEAVDKLISALINGTVEITDEIIILLKDAVVDFQGMVFEDEDAIAEAKRIVRKIHHLLGEEPADDDELAPAFADREKSGEGGEETKESKQEKVGEMVHYVRHLLSEDKEELDE